MTEKQVFPETVASAIKGQNPLNPNSQSDDTNLNTILSALAANSGGGGGSIPADTPVTDIDFGSIPKGTDISGMTVAELLDAATHAEYAPKFTDASASIAANIGAVVETGTTVPTTDESNFTIGGTAAKTKGGSYVANGGAATNSITCNVSGTGEAKTTFGNVVYTLSRAYAAGSDVVKTSKGNATNKTAANETTLIASASVNNNIDATTKVIKAITEEATCTIAFVDAFYANTAAIGTMAKLPLTTAVSLELDFPVAAGDNRHAFSIPSSYQNVQIYIWNAVSNGGEWQLYAGTFETSSETKTLADGVTTKAYTKYTRDTNGAATKFKVTFTKA